ncbi:MAG: tyrosine-type recombinase/integrase [Epsilonproteobacteria bacterium]|nr:tyrosine-type recombinase/integrase [Campylobacterota bacterium]
MTNTPTTATDQKEPITLNELFEEYIELIRPLQSGQTVRVKISAYNKHIKPLYGDSDIKILKYKDYQTLVNNLLDSGLKPKTVRNIKDIIQVMYKMAIKLEYTDKNPLLDVELPKYDNRRYFTYSTEIQKKFIASILVFEEAIYSDIFIFLLHGRRLSEVLLIEWEMIDLEQRLYHIPARINKAKQNMTYKMTDLLFQILYNRYFRAQIKQDTKYPTGYIFVNPNTNRPYVDMRKPWKRLLKGADLPKVHIHDIRHLIGTYTINTLELPVEKVSQALGHTSIEITQRYITPKPENAREVAQSMFSSVERLYEHE